MTDITISVTLTKNLGAPAMGEVLADIDLWLTQQDRATGATVAIWTGVENPTIEQINVGKYTRIYQNADLDLYNYHAVAHYTGLTSLDQDWINGSYGIDLVPIGTAKEHDYRVWAGSPQVTQEGVDVYFYEETNTLLKWNGVTDMNGWAVDIFGNKPRLDPGTYKVRRYKGGIVFDNPDTEVVT
jgi:hypothetical protein